MKHFRYYYEKYFQMMILVVLGILIVINSHLIVAYITTRVYTWTHYGEYDMRFVSDEYIPALGQHVTTYRDNEGNTYNFVLAPEIFPVQVIHDPIRGEG